MVTQFQSSYGGKSPLHWNGAQVEHYPQSTLMASYGDVKVKVLVTPTSQQFDLPWFNGGLHPCLIVYLEERFQKAWDSFEYPLHTLLSEGLS